MLQPMTAREIELRRAAVRQELSGARGAGAGLPAAYVTQVERVWRAVAATHEGGYVSAEESAIAAFRRARLIPARLTDRIEDLHKRWGRVRKCRGLSATGLAVCFAASAYPRLPSLMDGEELDARVGAFLEVLAGKADIAGVLVSLGRLPAGASQAWESLVTDLGAADCAPGPGDEAQERRDGAALYLATCPAEMVRGIHDTWLSEAGFVRFMRRIMLIPPSEVLGPRADSGALPDWGALPAAVAARLRSALPGGNDPGAVDPDHVRAAARLEESAWREARHWTDRGRVQEAVGRFWREMVVDRLGCGFPYYAFLGEFSHWWSSWLRDYRWREAVVGPLPADLAQRPAAGAPELTPHLLRLLREGYRLVRSTFFPRGVGNLPSHEIALHNEDHRRSIDAVWHAHLMALGSGAPRSAEETGQAEQGVNRNTTDCWLRRVRQRMWAYVKARVEGCTEGEVREFLPPGTARRYGRPHPLDEDAPMSTVIAVARAARHGHTLLWPLTAHLLLNWTQGSRWRDPYTFSRYVLELWHWVTDEAFGRVLAEGHADGSRADGEALDALHTDPLKSLVEDLRTLVSEQQVRDYLEEPGRRELLARQEGEALGRLSKLAGPRGLHAAGVDCRACASELRELVPPHWVAPVWFLQGVQRAGPRLIAWRLQGGPERCRGTVRAVKRVAECRLCGGDRGSSESARIRRGPIHQERQSGAHLRRTPHGH